MQITVSSRLPCTTTFTPSALSVSARPVSTNTPAWMATASPFTMLARARADISEGLGEDEVLYGSIICKVGHMCTTTGPCALTPNATASGPTSPYAVSVARCCTSVYTPKSVPEALVKRPLLPRHCCSDCTWYCSITSNGKSDVCASSIAEGPLW